MHNELISFLLLFGYLVSACLCSCSWSQTKALQLVTIRDIMATFGELQEHRAEVEKMLSYNEHDVGQHNVVQSLGIVGL